AGSDKADDDGKADDKDQADDNDDDDASNPFAAMAGNPLAAMFAKKLGEPGPYDPPTQSDEFDEDAPHLRVLKLAGAVAEVESFGPRALITGGGGGVTPTRALLDERDELAAEPKLAGLVVRVGDLSMDMARAEELRAGLVEFKGDGARKLHCHAE